VWRLFLVYLAVFLTARRMLLNGLTRLLIQL